MLQIRSIVKRKPMWISNVHLKAMLLKIFKENYLLNNEKNVKNNRKQRLKFNGKQIFEQSLALACVFVFR